jgi:uncharacterized protein (DUF1778 family)
MRENKTIRKELLISPSDLALIEAACEMRRTCFSAFVREAAIKAAKSDD